MMFLTFNNTEERRRYGGSAFLEIQYCTLPEGTPAEKLVCVDSISHRDYSSLYVHIDELDKFYAEYRDIFQQGLYNNMCVGAVDIYGINYYTNAQATDIINKLETARPKDYEILLEWLQSERVTNGFYILGI